MVITCNYRLGAFGFWFNLDDDNVTAPGNVALLDQLKCLQWIQRNSRAFGGNPLKVTLWGQSAGASSVGFHLQYYYLNPNQSQLFHQVLLQSWPAGIQPRSLAESKLYNDHFAEFAGCLDHATVTQCLRGKKDHEILAASNNVRFDVTTYYDKLITVGLPWQATLGLSSFFLQFNNVDFINRYSSLIKIPILWGTDKDEGTLFIYEAIPQSIPIVYPMPQAIISAVWHPQNLFAISALYGVNPSLPPNVTADYHDVIGQILGDYVFTCTMRNMSRALVQANNSNIFFETTSDSTSITSMMTTSASDSSTSSITTNTASTLSSILYPDSTITNLSSSSYSMSTPISSTITTSLTYTISVTINNSQGYSSPLPTSTSFFNTTSETITYSTVNLTYKYVVGSSSPLKTESITNATVVTSGQQM
ncbi:unnamed protein product, partial [Rotaria sp. Silwood1]